jgi:23S rRNA (pseudouridine1915-N3)-methyltransferase
MHAPYPAGWDDAAMQVELVRADLIVVGSLSAEVAVLVADYERRLTRYLRFDVHEVKAEPVQRGATVVLRTEGDRFAKVLDRVTGTSSGSGGSGGAARIVALDSRGTDHTTEQLAERWLAAPHLVLLIGGTLGLAPEITARARERVSFGRITLPHQLARLVATEQLYRSFRIARGEPYHF